MTDLAHWQDDLNDVLGVDFDGSLSGLCIMSLSFDFTKNRTTPILGATSASSRDASNAAAAAAVLAHCNHTTGATGQQQQQPQQQQLPTTTTTTTTTVSAFIGSGSSSRYQVAAPASSLISAPAPAPAAPAASKAMNASQPSLSPVQTSTNTGPISGAAAPVAGAGAGGAAFAAMRAAANKLASSQHQAMMSHEAMNDNSNSFFNGAKRCKTSQEDDETSRTGNKQQVSNGKIAAHLQELRNTIGSHHSSADRPELINNNNNSFAQPASAPQSCATESSGVRKDHSEGFNCQRDLADDIARRSPSDVSCPRALSVSSNGDESSRSSPLDDRRTITPSSISSSHSNESHSRSDSSRSQSPASDVTVQSYHSNASNADRRQQLRQNKQTSNQSKRSSGANNANNNNNISTSKVASDGPMHNQNHQGVLASLNTSVITSENPMHFRSLHSFSIKQFPASPFHQFSNSSFNHDNFYDRYHYHDSHPPLQTPVIGIERTQDLLRLPPHGPEEFETTQRGFSKDWGFNEDNNNKSFSETIRTKLASSGGGGGAGNQQSAASVTAAATVANQTEKSSTNAKNHQDNDEDRCKKSNQQLPKGFPFNYKSNSSVGSNDPIGTNNNTSNNSLYKQSMKHFNQDASECYDLRSKHNSPALHSSGGQQQVAVGETDGVADDEDENQHEHTIAHQYHGQESMFGLDPSKHKFRYVLAAPISIATKQIEDSMTYLNQSQAYEIKLENLTDVAEAKRGFMCSIINIGFHERHMQQVENELWQQWSQQHPNEKIFSVDMKLSYNVFGMESDGLNKYEFLWDSSKPAGVFIRVNSISTEFTVKKHGGEKGVPFKLAIETFSYNSKTHDSYFISAACCQMKVFKPKGAERKLRSDRDKIFKKAPSEQEKYHKPSDRTMFRECSLSSLHPMIDGSGYYRHSHGHFASKQCVTASGNSTCQAQQQQQQQQQDQNHQGGALALHSDEEADLANPNSNNEQELSPASHPLALSQGDRLNGLSSHGSETGSSRGQQSYHSLQDYVSEPRPVHQQQQPLAIDKGQLSPYVASKNMMDFDCRVSTMNSQQQQQAGQQQHQQQHMQQQQQLHHQHHHNQQQQHQQVQHHHHPHQQQQANCFPQTLDNHSQHQNHHDQSIVALNEPYNQHQLGASQDLVPLPQANCLNQMYHHHHSNHSVRAGVASLAGINNSQHFGMAYYSHSFPSSLPPHIAPPVSYGSPASVIHQTQNGAHQMASSSRQQAFRPDLNYADSSSAHPSEQMGGSNTPNVMSASGSGGGPASNGPLGGGGGISESQVSRINAIIKLTEQLLDAIDRGDFDKYKRLCAPSITAFEPESLGNLIEGTDFHQTFFERQPVSSGYRASHSRILNPSVLILSDESASIAYVRLIITKCSNGIQTQQFEETRIWLRRDQRWMCVHSHKSKKLQ